VAEGRQRNRAIFSGMVRGVSNPPEGPKILTFPFRPHNYLESRMPRPSIFIACW
jgi:hypothetical protein